MIIPCCTETQNIITYMYNIMVPKLSSRDDYYFAPGGGAQYCDQPFCRSICLCSHAYLKNDRSKLHQILLLVACGCGTVLL